MSSTSSFVKSSSHWASKIWSHISNDFNLNSVQAHHFFCSEWELVPANAPHNRVSLPYLIYRGLFMTILLTCITFSTSCQSHLFHIFLTNWSFTSQNVYGVLLFSNVLWRWWTFRQDSSTLASVSVPKKNSTSSSSLLSLGHSANNCHKNSIVILEMGDHKEKGNKNDDDISNVSEKANVLTTSVTSYQNGHGHPNYDKENGSNMTNSEPEVPLTYLEKAIWILINVVHVLPYCVVLGYWCVVYKYDPDQPFCEKFRSHYIVHGATAFLAIFDQLIIAIPARPTHFLIPTGLVLFYVVFTCLYEAIGGPYRPGKQFIYSVLDWKSNPKKAVIFSVLAVVVTPLAHIVFCWGIYRLRAWLKSIYLRFRIRHPGDNDEIKN